jgi:hypothetical protein
MLEDFNNDVSRNTNSTMNEFNVTNREEVNNNSDPLNLFRRDISANGSIKATPLSANKRKKRNLQNRKAEEKAKNQEEDKALDFLAFQNRVEDEFPFPPTSSVRQPPKPKSSRSPKVKEPIPWCPPERLLHRPWKSTKPSEPPKPKKIRLPPFDYVVCPNVKNVAKTNNISPAYPIVDDDNDEDDDYDDYYDGVAEYRTVRPNATTNNSHMLPNEIPATHSTKARIIGNVRCVDKSLKRNYLNNYRYKKKEEKRAEEEKKWAEEEDKKRAEKEDKRKVKREKQKLKKKNYRQALIGKKRDCIKPYVSSLQCEWSHVCQWGCGYVHLNRATKHMKSNCCYNGLLSPIGDSPLFLKYGNLKPMTLEMQDLMINEIEHMGPLSSTYGNVLSLAAIGVENGCKATGVINTHVGGFECRGHGAPDCVTMYGRTFHYLTMARDLASGIGK